MSPDYRVQIADALAAAHLPALCIAPQTANVIVTEQGRIKVLDFGLASWSIARGWRRGTTPPPRPTRRL